MGMKRVKECGGACFVQDPDEAEHGDMPRACIATALVDQVLAVAEIPGRIIAYQQSLREIRHPRPARRADRVRRRGAAGDLRPPASAHRPRLQQLQARPRCCGGSSGGCGVHGIRRHPQLRPVRARPAGRIAGAAEGPADQRHQLLSRSRRRSRSSNARHSAAVRRARARTITCACGCRAARPARRRTRRPCCWPSAAPTGPGAPAIQLFATDIDEAAIAAAREGVYTINDAADVSPERLRAVLHQGAATATACARNCATWCCSPTTT